MVRAGSKAPSTGRAPSVSKTRKNRDKPYKIHFESVMAKKKKLKILDIHGSAKPLNGYTYLPVGFADLAEECKELSRRKDADVGVVSAGSRSAATDPSKLSHHIYRVGYHFRTDIFDVACNNLGYSQRNGKLEKITGSSQSSGFEQTMSRYGSRFDLIDLTNRSEETSLKVKQHIRELFPKIPEADLQEIYERAWEQGASTVGNANDLSLSRQVQLATIARIRHTYTDYDHLLRVGSWKDARTAVERKCLTKLIEWRGEHDHDPEELEEILRETIVIDDESDDEDADASENQTNDEGDSDTSLEIMQQTIAPKDLRVEPNESNGLWRHDRPRRRTQHKSNPAVLQARWQNARSQRYGDNLSRPGSDQASRITVALDNEGKAPRTLLTGGVQYIRLSPDSEASMSNTNTQTPLDPGRHFGPGSGHTVVRPLQRMSYAEQNPKAWAGNRNATYPSVHDMDDHNRLPNAAVQSIEQPYDAVSSNTVKVAHRGVFPLIDLTTPPKPRLVGGYSNLADEHVSYENQVRHAHVHDHPPRDNYMVTRPRSQIPVSAPVQSRPMLPRHHSGRDIIDLTRSHDYLPSREKPVYMERGATQQVKPLQPDRVYPQPVYGQAAYPQMRSQCTPAPATPPRPVHGAPAIVQPVSSFGAPSPQRFFVGSGKPAYGLPQR